MMAAALICLSLRVGTGMAVQRKTAIPFESFRRSDYEVLPILGVVFDGADQV